MDNFKEISQLRFWCQKVLPLVYDDSLSYYELLGKISKKLNDLIENNALLPDFIADLIRQYISSGEIEKVMADIMANYMLNVKFPPKGLTPAKGDGTADDTEAIQGCIDYAFNHGGMAVYFPSGKYLTQPLILRNKATLFGQDRYTTQLVMKGGAITSMFTGTVGELSLTGLGFNGNMAIQVNNVNLFDITVTTAIISNVLLTDGYDLLKVVVNKDLQISNVIFDHAVENGLVLSGTGFAQGSNLVFNSVSTLVGKNFIVLGTSNSILESVKCYGASPNCVLITGNNNIVKLWNEQSLKAYTDNGSNNTVEVYTQSEQINLSGDSVQDIKGFVRHYIGKDYVETITGKKTEAITGNKEVTANNLTETLTSKTENVTGNKDVTANNLTENITTKKQVTVGSLNENITGNKIVTADNVTETIEHDKVVNVKGSETHSGDQLKILTNKNIMYSKPSNIEGYSDYFNYVNYMDTDNNVYSVLTHNAKTGLLGKNNGIYDLSKMGAIAGTDITTLLQSTINTCPAHGCIYIPWLGNKYILSSTITINKPLTLISNYYGYEYGEGATINGVPLFEYTGTGTVFDIKTYGTRIIGITMKANKATGFKYSYTGGAAPFPRFTVIKDCVVDNGDNGFNFTDAFRTIIENCMAYNCNNGFLCNTNTTMTFINCWGRNITGSAFNFVKSNYSTLINCAADTINGDFAYYFQECYSIGIVNCGCEVSDKRAFGFISCKGINASYHCQQNCTTVNDSSSVFVDGTSYGVFNGASDSNNYTNNNVNILIAATSNICVIGSAVNTITYNDVKYNFNGAFWNSKNPS